MSKLLERRRDLTFTAGSSGPRKLDGLLRARLDAFAVHFAEGRPRCVGGVSAVRDALELREQAKLCKVGIVYTANLEPVDPGALRFAPNGLYVDFDGARRPSCETRATPSVAKRPMTPSRRLISAVPVIASLHPTLSGARSLSRLGFVLPRTPKPALADADVAPQRDANDAPPRE